MFPMKKGRKRIVFVPYNGKIGDLTHADTSKHFLGLEAALSETRKIIGLFTRCLRQSGTGGLRVYPNEGSIYIGISTGYETTVIIADGTQRMEYNLSVANDDFDFYCLGYMVEV